MKKTILIDARVIASSTGTYVRQLLNHLPKTNDAHYKVLMSRDHFRLVNNSDVELIDFGHQSYGVKDQLVDQYQLPRLIGQLKPDLVHYTMPFVPLRSRTPYVVTMHDFNRFDFPDPNLLKQKAYETLVERGLKNARHIITPSNYVKNDVLSRMPDIKESAITRTYEAGDLTDETAEPVAELEGQNFYLHLGNGKGHKNIKLLLETWDRHRDQINARLAVIGDFTREQLAEQGPISEEIITPGWATETQKRWAYENCHAFITASLAEGFGLPGVEAMVAGAPVLSSNATCLPEIYGPDVLYFDPKSTDELVAAINALSDSNRETIHAKNMAWAQRYSWDTMAAETLAVYQRSLK